ncbi:DNA repair protein RadA [candidate division KSB1 bacterium]
MDKTKTRFFCGQCGAESIKWQGRCPNCGEWNSLVEERVAPTSKSSPKGYSAVSVDPDGYRTEGAVPLSQVTNVTEERHRTGLGEFDRVLGGGLLPGSLILVGGDPGIGKSTLVLEALARAGGDALYVSAEESVQQVRARATRLGLGESDLLIMSETDLETVSRTVQEKRPKILAVDSIQAVFLPSLESAPGSLGQVRECGARVMYLSKGLGIASFLIGHVTKDGAIAGPRTLEHMVDTVLYLEGERHHNYRILRSVKNRFGSTQEIGIFEMTSAGMQEVRNPSEIFLSEGRATQSGSVVIAAIEGTRPFLVELQALVSTSGFGTPQRVSAGFDRHRLALILAVLEKRIGLGLAGTDVFISLAGGFRIDEPGADLGAALAIASSFRDSAIDSGLAAVGEIGLSGEVRPVAQIEKRVSEAARLGFTSLLVPRGNLKGLKPAKGIEVTGIADLSQALSVVGI